MLALVHPFASDVPHRAPAPSSSRTRSQSSRKSTANSAASGSAIPSSSSSSSSTTSLTPSTSRAGSSRHPLPALQRQHTAPLPSASASSQPTSQPPLPHRQSSPPPRVPRAPSPEQEAESEPAQPMPQQEAEARVDIHSFPPADLLSLLAQLLTHIASANDEIGASGINAASAEADYHRAPIWNTLTTASRQALATPSSTLTFHARNVPTISLEAYLVRILKYCPTTNEVFLSLLVYFDRMSKLSLEATGRTFVIDSFNIHRLVIAGVTVASKFFSDVFYTNSRYAKVGGLPLTELNQLELQFLLLNNFSLVISEDEMQQYAEQLVLFSQNHSLSSLPSSIASMAAAASPASHTGSVAPTPAMGAMDAYGGQIPTHPASTTPHADVREPAPPSAISAFQQPRYSGDDTETETETETETDGGSTTDDEPTIRPAHSSAGSISDDASSLYSTSTTSEDADDEEADEIMDGEGMREMDIVEDSDGGRTPDVRKYFGGSTPPRMHAANDDSRMASP